MRSDGELSDATSDVWQVLIHLRVVQDARSSSSGASAISIPPSSGLAHIPEQGMASAANKAAAEA